MQNSKFSTGLLIALALSLSFTSTGWGRDRGITNTSSSPYVAMRSVDIGDVRWTEGLWADRFENCRDVIIPNMWRLLNDPDISHAWRNFEIVAGLETGDFKGTRWYDGDVYKWIETVAHVYAITPDPELDAMMDRAIEVIGKAQDDDGYISTFVQIGKGIQTFGEGGDSPYQAYKGVTRWQDLRHHEFYNMGHLMTTGAIHYRATGKRSLLEIAIKTGDYLYSVFQPRPKELAHFGFNPSNIMGAMELYRTTRDKKYLELAGIFVDMRGSEPGGSDQNQARIPLRQENEVVGHAVTGGYLYCGAADVYAETGERELMDALKRLWRDFTYKKMYITGGACAIHNGFTRGTNVHEAYGLEYDLPNLTAYNETCSNIASGMWNWRMFAATGEGVYMDMLEKVLYNTGISGISLDGKLFCYTNNLRWYGKESKLLKNDTYTRLPYLGCFCCPPNVSRTIAKVAGWAYGVSDNTLWVNLYGGNHVETELPDGAKVVMTQESDYPWDGAVKLTAEQMPGKPVALKCRVPGWSDGVTIRVNGEKWNDARTKDGYVVVERRWKSGDTIMLDMPMPVKLMQAHPRVEQLRNQVAVQRGPVVYCIESHDLPAGTGILDVHLPKDIRLNARHVDNLLGGVTIIEGRAGATKHDWSNKLYADFEEAQKRALNLRLIPYYAWNNRGPAHMTVWLPLAY
ncbi:MAG: glycoside hydrolase family 127 protein [Planctomycetota bacterium]|jgi:DUF1680 family protein